MRSSEPGWSCVSMHDSAGRRGVWYRADPDRGLLELCGGREGDDCFAALAVGHTLTRADLSAVADVLRAGAFEVEGGISGPPHPEALAAELRAAPEWSALVAAAIAYNAAVEGRRKAPVAV